MEICAKEHMNFAHHAMEVIGTSASLWTYIILFIIAFLDTLIVIGAFFPASFFVMAAGFCAAHTDLNIWISSLFIISGGLIGDLLSYILGKKGVNWFKGEKKLLKASYLDKGQIFFHKYGDKSIIFGRFLGIIKSVIPFVAGLIKMDIKKFIFLNTIAGIIWTLVHIGIGFILGKSLDIFDIPRDIKLIVFSLPFILFFAWTVFEFRVKIFKYIKKN